MTLRHMKIYVAVFRRSSITRAAEELHLAQPSVSLSVKELEEYYGVRLFERIGRRIYPTECGKQFYEYALHIVSLFDEMEQKIRNWDTLGTLRIGASITIGTHILPALIRRYQPLYPDLRVEVSVRQSAYIEQSILESSIDIGLIENTPEDPDLKCIPFMEDTLCAIAAPDNPLAGLKTVSLAQMAEYPFLMREKGSAGREILDACFSLSRLSVRPLWESASTQAIVRAVSEGLGVAVLPYLLVKKEIGQGAVAQLLLDHPLDRNLNIIFHKNKFLTENMDAFIRLCRDYGSPIANPQPSRYN